VSPILEVVAPRLLGPALMVAAALIVKGYADVGDGFSAAVIVALALGLRYIVLGPERTEAGLPIVRHAPAVATGGLVLALAVAFFPIVVGDPPFTHLPGPGEEVVKIGSLELITAVAFDVGLFVLVLSALTMLIHALGRLVAETER